MKALSWKVMFTLFPVLLFIPLLLDACSAPVSGSPLPSDAPQAQVTSLPDPRLEGPLSLEEAIQRRRSTRSFTPEPLTMTEISQLLWAAQGITDPRGYRAAPSAGALYPLELYVLTPDAAFHYEPDGHAISMISIDDLRAPLYEAALSQEPILEAPLILVVTAVYERTAAKYGAERGARYVQLEAGHAAQNVLLQAVSLGLGAVSIGAFDDRQVGEVLSLPPDHQPLYLIAVGHPE
jgi:SagB-type dehydrogenase family enzyme